MRVSQTRQKFHVCAESCCALLAFFALLFTYCPSLNGAEAGHFLRRTIKAHSGQVAGIDISPDNSLIVSGGSDGIIAIWSVSDGKQTHRFGEYKRVSDVSFSPEDKRVACTGVDSRKKDVLHIWDYEDEKLREEIEGHSQPINAVAYSPNGRMIASGSDDNTLRTWYANGREIHAYEAKRNDFLAVSWSPDNDHIAGGLSWDGNILVWDTARDDLELTLVGHSDWVNAVLFSPDGKKILSGGKDGSVRIWNFESGKEQVILQESWWGEVNDLAISGDGTYLAGATSIGAVVIWYADSGKVLAVLTGHTGPVTSVAFSSDNNTVVSGGSDGTIRIWTPPPFSGSPEALHQLAAEHDKGSDRINKDPTEALKWYMKSAEAGYPKAMTRLGEMYGKGEGAELNRQKAVKWLAAAVAKDDAEAMFALGDIYATGLGVPADPGKAAELWAKAVENGHLKAAEKLNEKVESIDVEKVDERSIAWLKKVAELGHAEAQYRLGRSYAAGAGVDQSAKEAFLWYKKAADQGHIEALYQTGVSYAEGKGVEKDDRKAITLIRQAAGKGKIAAKYRLAIFYCTGKGATRDYAAAVRLWKEAADKGDVMSMFFLGYMYETGSGVKRNQKKAKKYYEEAAKKGNAFAMQSKDSFLDKK